MPTYTFGPSDDRKRFKLVTDEHHRPTTLLCNQQRVSIQRIPLKVLLHLVRNSGLACSAEAIYEAVRDRGEEYKDVESYVQGRISVCRQKLGDPLAIETIRGVGYVFTWSVPLAKADDTVTEFDEPISPKRWMPLDDTHKVLFGRDREALILLKALTAPGPGLLSLSAPPGFGKTSVYIRAIQRAIPSRNPTDVGLNGVAILDGREISFDFASIASFIERLIGVEGTAARIASCGSNPSRYALVRQLFTDLVRHAGKIWLILDNADAALSKTAPNEVAELLDEWCTKEHQAKLLIVSRHQWSAMPPCHRRLKEISESLLTGLPVDHALALLRAGLKETTFRKTEVALLREIVRRLHGVPMAIEQFTGYLGLKEGGITLNRRFVERNELLRLFDPRQLEKFFLRVVEEHIGTFDSASTNLLRTLAWAETPITQTGLLHLAQEFGSTDGPWTLTNLLRSGLIQVGEDPVTSFSMHPIIEECARSLLVRDKQVSTWPIVRALGRGAMEHQSRWESQAELKLWALVQRASVTLVESEKSPRGLHGRALASAGRANALLDLGRLHEALKAYDDAIGFYRRLPRRDEVSQGALAHAMMMRSGVLHHLQRYDEALDSANKAYGILKRSTTKVKSADLIVSFAGVVLRRAASYRALYKMREAFASYSLAESFLGTLRQDLRTIDSEAIRASIAMSKGNAFQSLGKLREALGAYDDALEISRAIIAQDDSPERTSELAGVMMNKGAILGQLGKYREAFEVLDEALEMYSSLIQNHHRAELMCQYASVLAWRSGLLRDTGNLAEALTDYGAAIEIYQKAIEEDGRAEMRRPLALNLMNRSLVLAELGRLDEARKGLTESIGIYQVFTEGMADDDVVAEMARAIGELGAVHALEEDFENAYRACDEATALYLQRLAHHPSPVYERRFARQLLNRSLVLLKLGDTEGALNDCLLSIEVCDKLSSMDQTSDSRRSLGRALSQEAILRHNRGEFALAIIAEEKAIRAFNEIPQENRTAAIEDEAARAVVNLMDFCRLNGRLNDADELGVEVIAKFGELIGRYKDHEFRVGLALAHHNLALTRQAAGNARAALIESKRANILWKKIEKDGRRRSIHYAESRALENELLRHTRKAKVPGG